MKDKENFTSKLSYILGPKFKIFYLFYTGILLLALFFQIFAVAMIFPLVSVFLGNSFENQYLEYMNKIFGSYFDVYDFSFILYFTCALIILANLIFLFSSFLSAKIAFSIEKETRVKLYSSFLKGSYVNFLNINSSYFLNLLINETQRFASQILLPFADIFSRIILAIGLSIFLFINLPVQSVAIVTLVVLFYFIFFFLIRPVIKKNNLMLTEENKKLIKFSNEIFKTFKEIKIYNIEDRYSRALYEVVSKIKNIRFFTTFFSSSPRFILEILIFILLIVFFKISRGSFVTENLSSIAIFVYCLFKILPSIQGVFTQYVVIKSNSNAVDSIYTKLKNLNLSQNQSDLINKNKKNNEEIFKSIELVDFNFEYLGKEIFQNLNFKVNKGEKIGITGPSGVGKTTFLNLFTGLISPISGKFKLNDKKYEYDTILSAISKIVSFVPQSISINENSIYDNILLDKEFDEKLFKKVSEISGLNEFVNSLEEKFDTKLHSSTANLSGGQIQRIALARALYRDPKILIIDEGFNQLDKKLENDILNLLINDEKLTLIIVFHKMSNFGLLDTIYKIEDKKILKVNYEKK